jgi:tol-pal system protein YbgF
MRSTLAFAAGIIVGFLLAWASGPAITQRVSDWSALLRTAVPGPMRIGLESLQGKLSPVIGPSEKLPSAAILRRPVTRSVRMTRSNLILALPSFIATNATAPVAAVPEAAQTDADNGPIASSPSLTGSVKAEALAENASDALPGPASLAEPVSVSASPASSGAKKGSKNKAHAVTPEGDYARALKSYQSGRHALAREQFAAFLQAFPGHSLVPNALYWSGETWYAQAHYDHAAKFFAQVVQDHPRHSKSPDALLKLGYSAMRQGLLDQAGVYLRQLETRYPDSPASRLGRQAQGRLQGQNSSKGVVLARG